jgi:regulatory protein
MSAQQDSSAQGRGSTDAGRPAGPAPHREREDGVVWSDGADDGAAAWDQAPAGDASAWDHGDDAGAAWDAPISSSIARSGWGEDAAATLAPRSVWDDDAPAPASTWDDDAPAPAWGDATTGTAAAAEPAPDVADAPARRRRAPRPDAARPVPPASDAAPSSDDGAPFSHEVAHPSDAAAWSDEVRPPSDAAAPLRDDTAPPADEVAAVAARLAEIVGRSGARPRLDVSTTPTRAPAPAPWGADPDSGSDPDDDADPDAGQRRGTASGRGYGSARAYGSSRSSARPGGRRGGGGRRGAPASEPPEDGPAAQDAEPDHESVARSVALRLLTGAPKSRHQLAEAMAKRDVPEEVADRVLDRFTEVGLVDDAAYAEILVRSRHTERGLSRRALAQELRRRGVDDETAQEALEQVDDADEEQAARALARKKLRATRGLDRETRLRRAYGALGRRGYGGSLVSRVVREELDAEGADEPDAEHWSGGFGGG